MKIRLMLMVITVLMHRHSQSNNPLVQRHFLSQERCANFSIPLLPVKLGPTVTLASRWQLGNASDRSAAPWWPLFGKLHWQLVKCVALGKYPPAVPTCGHVQDLSIMLIRPVNLKDNATCYKQPCAWCMSTKFSESPFSKWWFFILLS